MTWSSAAGTFTNPLNFSADPTLTYVNGHYHLATTLGDRIGIWKSPTLAGLASAPENTVWRDGDPSRNQQMWAFGGTASASAGTSFTLTAGDENKVGISRWTNGTGLMIADAVRITRLWVARIT